jgi:hypothetical protein
MFKMEQEWQQAIDDRTEPTAKRRTDCGLSS